ncbi:MAG: Unknown protein [uncultured Thiotrichaceae bacterium]|uniref:Beta-lactamase-related domain-containing protein n=1 Tax=uncultured Thiotrichaceae bacterium TaxID=298394 RepID=A0A6S6TUK8_9GAMM|nr:MAG: Unknown protein [uncultured Thiotrichaceae bacterium]
MIYPLTILLIILSLVFLAALSFLWFLNHRFKHTPDKGNLEAALDTEVEKFIRKKQDFSLVVGVYKEGKTHIKGYGRHEPDRNSLFQIGSITKVFTALLLQILCDEGLVNLEQTLDELIGTKVKLSDTAKKITLRQLAMHTSGLPRVPKMHIKQMTDKAGKASLMENPYHHLSVEDIFAYLATTEENHKVGKFAYSNYGMGLLAHVLESVTGKPYEALLEEKILKPLNMQQTAITLSPEMEEALIQGYSSKGKLAPVWTFNALAGAGALSSSASDMLKFIAAYFDMDTHISDALKQMEQKQNNAVAPIGWMKPGLVEKFFGLKDIIWHNGQVGGYGAYIGIDNKSQSGVVVLSNQSMDIAMLGIMLLHQVITQSWLGNAGGNESYPH